MGPADGRMDGWWWWWGSWWSRGVVGWAGRESVRICVTARHSRCKLYYIHRHCPGGGPKGRQVTGNIIEARLHARKNTSNFFLIIGREQTWLGMNEGAVWWVKSLCASAARKYFALSYLLYIVILCFLPFVITVKVCLGRIITYFIISASAFQKASVN